MSVPDEHERKLAARVGTWSVVSTLRLTPDAQPILQKGLIAQRRMIGLYMEEEMKPAPGSQTQDFHRLAYLTYSRVEGRWQYVSMDTRFPVGIMPNAMSTDVIRFRGLILNSTYAPDERGARGV
ncbi:MAG: hypothetical protein ACREVV_08280 [Steroidobacteraceae bacterium]